MRRGLPSPGILPIALGALLLVLSVYYIRQRQTIADVPAITGGLRETESTGQPKALEEKKQVQIARTADVKPLEPQPGLQRNRRPPLTVVCVSDTHGLFEEPGLIKVPPGDMLLFPGDAAVGTPAEGLSFSRWLQGLPITGPRVVTWGNMDTATPRLQDPVPGAIVLVNTIQEVNGYRIFASPWTPRFAGAYQLDVSGAELDAFWSKLLPPNSDVDIILTHGPPHGIADATGGRNRGDKGLLKAVQALQKPPLLWVCGHIHEQYGSHWVPHSGAPGGRIPLLNSAVYYVQQEQHRETAQPRAIRLPEAELLPRRPERAAQGAAEGEKASRRLRA